MLIIRLILKSCHSNDQGCLRTELAFFPLGGRPEAGGILEAFSERDLKGRALSSWYWNKNWHFDFSKGENAARNLSWQSALRRMTPGNPWRGTRRGMTVDDIPDLSTVSPVLFTGKLTHNKGHLRAKSKKKHSSREAICNRALSHFDPAQCKLRDPA